MGIMKKYIYLFFMLMCIVSCEKPEEGLVAEKSVNADTVLEVLIFLVSRHMIIGDTSAFEYFVSIVSIALLFAIKKYIQIPPEAGKRKSIFSTCRNEMGDEKSDGEE